MNPEPVTLHAGDARLILVPEVGGSIARYWSETAGGDLEWLRPGVKDGQAGTTPNTMSCYPLVPYSNRIRHGRFRFGGRDVALPLNFGDHPHSIHGQGWQSAWRVSTSSATRAVLEYQHAPDAWPWEYLSRLEYRLDPAALQVTLSLENRSDTPMPAGLGYHPYFPRTPETRLTASVEQVWLTDHEVMPTRRVPPPPEWNLGAGIRVNQAVLDNGFTGWKRVARIEWPEQRRRLTLTGGEGLEFLVVYTPKDRPYFCAEPVSHCTDAFNCAAQGERDTGMRELAPGQSWPVTMRLEPELPA
jgi:aldose 1-epimerase